MAVMPLVRGRPGRHRRRPARPDPQHPQAAGHRGRHHERLPGRQQPGHDPADPGRRVPARAGKANGRALAYLAHGLLGEGFGTAYDLSTILILWFAGASAMAGLINIVPRYLPRYGMAPEWTRAARPLVLIFTAIAVASRVVFRADVDAQGGAYATGVLVLMTSAAVAAAISSRRDGSPAGGGRVRAGGRRVPVHPRGQRHRAAGRGEDRRPSSSPAIVAVSLASRVWRTLELRVAGVELDDAGAGGSSPTSGDRPLHLLAHDPTLPRAGRLRGRRGGPAGRLQPAAGRARAVPGGLRPRRVGLLRRAARARGGGGRAPGAAGGGDGDPQRDRGPAAPPARRDRASGRTCTSTGARGTRCCT